jgi:hypothetical protein
MTATTRTTAAIASGAAAAAARARRASPARRVARPTSTSTSGSCRDRVDVRSRTRRAASSSTDDARDDRDANPVGFQSIADDDRDGGVVPKAVQDDYRKVEDPEWMERMLLREETEYPTSRGAVLRQALVNGDVKGVSYAMSSVKVAAACFAGAYVCLAAAGAGAEEGSVIAVIGSGWKWFAACGVASAATELIRVLEMVLGVEGRRKM